MKKNAKHIIQSVASANTVLSQSEELFRLLVFSVKNYAIFMLDTEGYIISWNEGAKNIKGYTEEEIIGKHLSVFYTPEDLAADEPTHNLEMAKLYGSYEKEGWRIRKDGSRFWADVVFTALYDGQYHLKGFAKVTCDITQRRKQENELQDSCGELRNLVNYLQDIREEEKSYLAREIHDELGQLLTALRFDICRTRSKLTDSEGVLKEQINESVGLVDTTIKTVRRIISELRPPILDEFGLTAALEWQSKEFTIRTGIKCFFTSNNPGITLTKGVAIALFRVYQEALVNVAKHSGATEVGASFMLTGNYGILSVKDNGKGFTAEEIKTKNRLGIAGMKERAKTMNGEFMIESEPDCGTCLKLRVPFIK
jgi:PAS domain S-box-containing protein